MGTLSVLDPKPLSRAALVSLLKTMDFGDIKDGSTLEQLQGGENGKLDSDLLLIKLGRETEAVASLMINIKTRAPACPVIFLAADFDISLLNDCFAAGASGYLSENISCDTFRESLKLVIAGGKVFPSELILLLPNLTGKSANPIISEARVFNLSKRDMDILRCLTRGQTNKGIADTLNIAESTVKAHVKRILRKTGVTNRTQAALWALGNS